MPFILSKVLPEESHSGTILDSFLDRTISSHSEHVDTAMPEDHVDHTFVQDEVLSAVFTYSMLASRSWALKSLFCSTGTAEMLSEI